MTRIVATSDFHGMLPEIPECDVLLVAGDVCPVENHDRKFQAIWLRSEFNWWLKNAPAKHIVWIGGNHDFVLADAGKKLHDQMLGTYLRDEAVEVEGLKIWASPMSPLFGHWAFMRDDRGLAELWETIPRDIDILMVHGPMHGHGDGVPQYRTYPMLGEGKGLAPYDSWRHELIGHEHVGSVSLLNRLAYDEFPNLKLFVFGHIHEGYGQQVVTLRDNQFVAANVSHVNEAYKPVNPPMEFDL